MRTPLILLAVAGLAACSPKVPDSAAGVGFGSYDDYQAAQSARNQQLRGGTPVVTGPLAAEQTAPGVPGAPGSQTEAQATAAAAVAAIQPGGVQTAAVDPNNSEISDEQDFDAVSSRQTIASDAQRRAQQSAQYQVVQPTAVPERPTGGAPTPIEFALQVQHPLGQKVYSRSPFGAGKLAENCAQYASSELAQDAFLKAGGPDKDKLKLDPDGDGYACAWNPGKYRQLVRN